jgi:hypothetical protein
MLRIHITITYYEKQAQISGIDLPAHGAARQLNDFIRNQFNLLAIMDHHP